MVIILSLRAIGQAARASHWPVVLEVLEYAQGPGRKQPPTTSSRPLGRQKDRQLKPLKNLALCCQISCAGADDDRPKPGRMEFGGGALQGKAEKSQPKAGYGARPLNWPCGDQAGGPEFEGILAKRWVSNMAYIKSYDMYNIR
jgi:hypothetical protein